MSDNGLTVGPPSNWGDGRNTVTDQRLMPALAESLHNKCLQNTGFRVTPRFTPLTGTVTSSHHIEDPPETTELFLFLHLLQIKLPFSQALLYKKVNYVGHAEPLWKKRKYVNTEVLSIT